MTATESTAVSFSNVSFVYEQPLLRDLTFAIRSGEMVGLAGASGCGKSTIARLIVRFLEPHAGRIEVFGRTDWPTAELRSMVCVVEQDPFVFRGTILDNLLLGDPSASREQAALAARLCGIAQDLDFVVREAGRDLSGGEKQRVALARAVLRNPRLLVLDEATSSLDGEAEGSLFTALAPWLRERTVIAVSHRLSTMRRFPRVLVLEEGRVAADGDPERLLHESPLFRALFADQIARPARTA